MMVSLRFCFDGQIQFCAHRIKRLVYCCCFHQGACPFCYGAHPCPCGFYFKDALYSHTSLAIKPLSLLLKPLWLLTTCIFERQNTFLWIIISKIKLIQLSGRTWRIILRWIFRKWEGVVRTGWSWLRIGTGGGHLWVRWGTFGFQKCGEFLD